MRGIIVLEGADGTGKTTLARELVRRHDAFYIHNGLWPNMWQRHLAAVDLAIKKSQKQLVVIDRLFLSEQIYGQVFRAGPSYDLGARCLDRVLMRHGAVTVLCVRFDLPGHVAHFEQLKATRREKFDRIKEVAERYLDLATGNLARAGNEYANQLTRFQDYSLRGDVLVYDFEAGGGAKLAGSVDYMCQRLQRRRNAGMPGQFDAAQPNLAGNTTNPKYLFVGEELSPRACRRAAPFLWNDEPSAASRFNAVLRELQFDETQGLWTNAMAPDDWLSRLREHLPASVRVVPLGKLAFERVKQRKFPDVRPLMHPQWDRRFRAKTPELYLKEVRVALS